MPQSVQRTAELRLDAIFLFLGVQIFLKANAGGKKLFTLRVLRALNLTLNTTSMNC